MRLIVSHLNYSLWGKEKAQWITLWRWKFDVQVQADCLKQEELAVSGRDEKARPTWAPEERLLTLHEAAPVREPPPSPKPGTSLEGETPELQSRTLED